MLTRVVLSLLLVASVEAQADLVKGFCGTLANSTGGVFITGDDCCSGPIKTIIEGAAGIFGTIPKLGDAAKHIQTLIQIGLQKSAEIVISKDDLVVATHYKGSSSCKLKLGGYYLVAYESPVQYNFLNEKAEQLFAALDAQEPLGSTLPAGVTQFFPKYSLSDAVAAIGSPVETLSGGLGGFGFGK